MNEIKIWIGNYVGNEKEYYEYFNDEENCGFCKDIGEKEYDPDFIGIIPLQKTTKSVSELAKLTPLGAESRKKLVADCYEQNIKQGNAVLFYSGDTRDIKIGESFNQLIYIGEFTP